VLLSFLQTVFIFLNSSNKIRRQDERIPSCQDKKIPIVTPHAHKVSLRVVRQVDSLSYNIDEAVNFVSYPPDNLPHGAVVVECSLFFYD